MDRASMHRQCLTVTSELPETLGGSYENYCCTVLTSSCSLFLFVASSAYSPRISSSRRCALIISFDAPRILGWSATGVGHGRGFRFRSCNNASTMRCGTACRSITVILSRVWRLNALEMMRSRTSQPPVVAVDPSVRGGARPAVDCRRCSSPGGLVLVEETIRACRGGSRRSIRPPPNEAKLALPPRTRSNTIR